MNPKWFGDSYDIVKCFFGEKLRSLGYVTYVDPMLTGDWQGIESNYYRLLGMQHVEEYISTESRSALLIDPDTGISHSNSQKHLSSERIVKQLKKYDIVFVFDQSFSRSGEVTNQMQEKLRHIQSLGAFGFYYNSHAKFLFISHEQNQLQVIKEHLYASGIPRARIFVADVT